MTTDIERDQAFEKVEKHKQFVQGLRELADFLEAHPGIPVASYGTSLDLEHSVYGLSKQDLIFAVTTPNTGRWEKGAVGSFFEVKRTFSGGVSLALNGDRDQVCERVVVGHDQRLVPASPAVEEHIESYEVVEWKCRPLLGRD